MNMNSKSYINSEISINIRSSARQDLKPADVRIAWDPNGRHQSRKQMSHKLRIVSYCN